MKQPTLILTTDQTLNSPSLWGYLNKSNAQSIAGWGWHGVEGDVGVFI